MFYVFMCLHPWSGVYIKITLPYGDNQHHDYLLYKIPVFPFADHLLKEINVVNNIHHHLKQPDLFFMHVPDCLNKNYVHSWAGDNSYRYV